MQERRSSQVGWAKSRFAQSATEEDLKKALTEWETAIMKANLVVLNQGVDPAFVGDWLINQGLGIGTEGLAGMAQPIVLDSFPEVVIDPVVLKMGGNPRGLMERVKNTLKEMFRILPIGGMMGGIPLPKEPGSSKPN